MVMVPVAAAGVTEAVNVALCPFTSGPLGAVSVSVVSVEPEQEPQVVTLVPPPQPESTTHKIRLAAISMKDARPNIGKLTLFFQKCRIELPAREVTKQV
jgi:hypothetical protein